MKYPAISREARCIALQVRSNATLRLLWELAAMASRHLGLLHSLSWIPATAGKRKFGAVCVLLLRTTANALAVPLWYSVLLCPKIVPMAFLRPEILTFSLR